MKTTHDYLTEFLNEGPMTLTLKHMLNRITSITLSGSALDDLRASLHKTVMDCNTMEEISYLRRDVGHGLTSLAKRADKTTDPAKKADVVKHMKWLRADYRDALTKRASELRSDK